MDLTKKDIEILKRVDELRWQITMEYCKGRPCGKCRLNAKNLCLHKAMNDAIQDIIDDYDDTPTNQTNDR